MLYIRVLKSVMKKKLLEDLINTRSFCISREGHGERRPQLRITPNNLEILHHWHYFVAQFEERKRDIKKNFFLVQPI